jgi:elongation factor G
MAEYTTADIRNIALVGQAGAGKTLLTDALLHAAGSIPALGSIEKGTTVSDFHPLEQQHQHSLTASVASLLHDGHHINLIDTPGYPDFIGSTLSVLPAVETVAAVIDAQTGIESMTRRLMQWAHAQKLCRMIVVNKIDVEDVDLAGLYAQIREAFGSECLAINLPAQGGTRVVDCFFNPSGEADFSSVADAHTAIVDQAVEVDEDLMEVYLEQGELAPEQLHDPFEQALREGHLVPVCFTSAISGAGVAELLNVIAKLMPNPMEGNPAPFVNGEGVDADPVSVVPDSTRHVLAHTFKIEFDPFVGRLGFLRIHQGTVNKDRQLFIGDARKSVKVGNYYSVQGKNNEDVDAGIPGDIRVLAKIDGLEYDAVLHDSHDEDSIHMRPLDLPRPMVGVAVASKTRGDEQKVSEALAKLVQEDPCLQLERNPSANETVLRGMGDLHLRVAVEKMHQQYNVEVQTSRPTVAYRETIARKAEGHCRHKKQTGGAGQFGEVYLRVEPLSRGSGFEFVDQVVGGVIPNQFIPAVEKGVRQVLENGAVAGFPVQDIRVTLYDGKHHSVDSKEIAFVSAGKKAFIDAMSRARPMVLEPVVDIEVTVPNANMGDITGDLSSRRGRVHNTDALAGSMVVIIAQVPLAEMDDYQSRLKSMTGGEGSFTMEFASYEPAPADVQKRLANAFQQPEEE